MKSIITLIFIGIACAAFSQSTEGSKRYEKALYNYRTQGVQILCTEFASTSAETFDETTFSSLESDMYAKEEIVKIESLKNGSINVYHSGEIKPEDLKAFFYPYTNNIYLVRSQKHTFQ